jgi:uncharacterized membrane protein
MNRRSRTLASAAAALFVAGGTGVASADQHEGGEAKVKCEGVNECKGHGECSGAHNECKGKNSCKGKSFLMLSPEECKEAMADMAEGEEEGEEESDE